MTKTNALRLLDAAGIAYRTIEFEYDETGLSHTGVPEAIGMDPDQVFKTLVTRGERLGPLVFCIPIEYTLDLRKAAQAAGDKKVEMIHMKDLLGLTGYVRGGCSPVGMKKQFPTFIDETALLYDEIAVSSGKRGMMMVLSPEELIAYEAITPVDLIEWEKRS